VASISDLIEFLAAARHGHYALLASIAPVNPVMLAAYHPPYFVLSPRFKFSQMLIGWLIASADFADAALIAGRDAH
jgi:hypothetical protein